jgi:hypothetical protein
MFYTLRCQSDSIIRTHHMISTGTSSGYATHAIPAFQSCIAPEKAPATVVCTLVEIQAETGAVRQTRRTARCRDQTVSRNTLLSGTAVNTAAATVGRVTARVQTEVTTDRVWAGRADAIVEDN